MFKKSAKQTMMTSCQCTLDSVSANTLIKHLGAPKYDDAELGIDRDDNPTSMQWVFEDDAKNVVTIYDWRGSAAFYKDRPVKWNIGATKKTEAVRFYQWLRGKLHALSKTETLEFSIFDEVPPGF